MSWIYAGTDVVSVERSTTLLPGSWSTIASNVAPSTYTDTNSPYPAAFYRLRSEAVALIPAGSFQIGNTLAASGDGYPDELPVHTVNVSAFYMDKYEVTKALWDQVRAWGLTNGYTDLPVGAGKAANHPVHSIKWYDAVKWSNARSQREGLTPAYTLGGSPTKQAQSRLR